MGEGRLNALAFMMANPDFNVDEEKVQHEWYMAKNRNIHLAFEKEKDDNEEEEWPPIFGPIYDLRMKQLRAKIERDKFKTNQNDFNLD